MPAGVDEFVDIVSVAVALEPGTKLTEIGVIAVARPEADCDGDAEMSTIPVNPRLSSVIVESAEPPTMKLEGRGEETVALKSPVTVIVNVTEWAMSPLVPVTVTLYAPAGVAAVVEKVRVEAPELPADNPTGFTVKDTEAPVAEAGTAAERDTVPVRPLLLSDMVVSATLPAMKGGGLVGEALIVKSGLTVTKTLTE